MDGHFDFPHLTQDWIADQAISPRSFGSDFAASTASTPPFERYLSAFVDIERSLSACSERQDCYAQILVQLSCLLSAFHVDILEFQAQSTEDANRELSSLTIHTLNAQQLTHSSAIWDAVCQTTASRHWLFMLNQGKMVHQTPSDWASSDQERFASQKINRILLFPLRVQHQPYGILCCYYSAVPTERNFAETSFLQGVAGILSLKLEQLHAQAAFRAAQHQTTALNFRLRRIETEHADHLHQSLNFEALLRRITERVRDSLDESQILQTAVTELAIGLNTYSCETGLYDLEAQTSTIHHEHICSSIVPSMQGTVLYLSDFPEIYSQLLQGQNGQFCWLPSVSIVPRQLDQALAVFCCPIINDQRVIGDIWLYHAADHGFTAEEVRLVEQVATQCAIAIRQARLYQESQAQVQALEHLNHLKDDFLNTVSHELRSPMANMEMAIQMLDLLVFQQSSDGTSTGEMSSSQADLNHDSNQTDPNQIALCWQVPSSAIPSAATFLKAARYFRMLRDECQREITLINDLLDLSRLEAGTEPLVLTTILLQDWVPHVVEPFLERARSQHQRLRIKVAADVPPLTTDLSSLERILSELLHNACKYTPAEETIEVSVQRSTHCLSGILITVSNSGVEISPSELPKVFDKFYRIPSHDLWQHGGTGLGLALVKRLTEHLQATIHAESTNNRVVFSLVIATHPGGT